MSSKELVDNLDDHTVVRILSYLTEDMQEANERARKEHVVEFEDQDEVRETIVFLLNRTGENSHQLAADEIVPEGGDNAALARRLLELLLDDEGTHDQALALVTEPPEDTKMDPILLGITAAVLLGTLVTWLQTKIDLKVHGKVKGLDVDLEVHKPSTDPEVIKDVVHTVGTVLTGVP